MTLFQAAQETKQLGTEDCNLAAKATFAGEPCAGTSCRNLGWFGRAVAGWERWSRDGDQEVGEGLLCPHAARIRSWSLSAPSAEP